MIKPLPPETLAWLRQTAKFGGVTAQALLHLLERLEALERRPIPGTVEMAADCSALDARAWAYIGKQAMCGDPAATALIDLLNEPSVPQPAPVADDNEPQTLHAIALRMVDTLEQLRISWPAATSESPASTGRLPNPGGSQSRVLPEILDTLRRAIREPMEQPTPQPTAPVAAAIRAALERLVKLRSSDTHALLGSDWDEAFAAARAALAQPPAAPVAQPAPVAAPAGGLVDEICRQLAIRRGEVRAVIRVVAAALLEWHRSDELVHTAWEAAKWLEREANQ
jgi:hypothetical protein